MKIPKEWILKRIGKMEWIGTDGHPTAKLHEAERFALQTGGIRHLATHYPEWMGAYECIRAGVPSPRTAPETFDHAMKGVR